MKWPRPGTPAKHPWVRVVLVTKVNVVWVNTTDEENTRSDEDGYHGELNNTTDLLKTGVTLRTKGEIDKIDHSQEDTDKDVGIGALGPVLDGHRSSDHFQGQDGEPIDSVTPSNSKPKRRVNKHDCLSIEPTAHTTVSHRQFTSTVNGQHDSDRGDNHGDNRTKRPSVA
ncbi:hypothetical protein WICPIJ_008036 [Wickerhamomyces pijperi]|uniref:Uncharacterized protein n=1 Tax=Wickerhamomyces pijperi TaxID=599730 RepID=A0A9P8TJC3_WICPI|nr:hypothetical protein WICPIJ_008036 [Wickerhamomyces pijperi]